MAAKRKLTKEFDSVSDAVLTKSAIIHGVVASVLSMKTGKHAKFFSLMGLKQWEWWATEAI